MEGEKAEFLVCDVCLNDQLLVDVNLLKTCPVANIVQGLWDDGKFRSAALNFLKTKSELGLEGGEETSTISLKSFHHLDRSILRAYVAIRFLPTWKWLEFKDFIADYEKRKETVIVADAFGNFCNKEHKPVLKIVPKRETEADDQEVKTIIKDLLQTKSLATLAATGCPLSKGMLSLIGQSKYTCTISYDKREKFVHWLRRQDFTDDITSKEKTTESQPMTPFKIAKSRVTFEPDGELAKLVNWFDANQRPDGELIEGYTNDLNKNRCGKSKRMLTQESIAVWFKNKRAKTKKEECSILEPWERDAAMAAELTNEGGVSMLVTMATADHNSSVEHKSARNVVDNEYLMSTSAIAHNEFEQKHSNIGVENEGSINNRTDDKEDINNGMGIIPVAMGIVDGKSMSEIQRTETGNGISEETPCVQGISEEHPCVQSISEETPCVQGISGETPCVQRISEENPCDQKGSAYTQGVHEGTLKPDTNSQIAECDEILLCNRNSAGEVKQTRDIEIYLSQCTDNDSENRKKHVELQNDYT